MPLFSICYISMHAIGWPPVATRSQQDFQGPDDREALSSKTELKCLGSLSIQEIKQWARESSCRMAGSGDQESEQRGVTRPYGRNLTMAKTLAKLQARARRRRARMRLLHARRRRHG